MQRTSLQSKAGLEISSGCINVPVNSFAHSSPLLTSGRSCSHRKISIILKKDKGEDLIMEEQKEELISKEKQDVDIRALRNIFMRRTISRVQHPLNMFFLTVLTILLSGTQNLYIFLGGWQERDIFFFATIIIRIGFFFYASLQLSCNKKVLLKLFLSFDAIFMVGVANIVGVCGFSIFIVPYKKYKFVYYSSFILQPMFVLAYAGYFRTLMVFCQWNRMQTLFIKFLVLLGASANFALALYFTITDAVYLEAALELTQTIKNMLLLYAFSGFDFYLELFGLMDSVDGTSYYKGNYTLHCEPDDMEILLHGKKITRKTKKLAQRRNSRSSRNSKAHKLQISILQQMKRQEEKEKKEKASSIQSEVSLIRRKFNPIQPAPLN